MGSSSRQAVDCSGLMVTIEDKGLSIEPAVEFDIDAIAEIERQSFGDPWTPRDFIEVMSARQAIFLVARNSAGAVAAYAIAMAIEDEGEILNIAVSPALAGRGHGGSLLDTMLERLRDRGVASVFLEVRESNERARGLYASRGFDVISKRRRYYRNPVEDALILRLALK